MTHAPVLVTGADQHQGLAVIRGLGRAGFPVIACGPDRRSIGFASRYVTARAVYRSPFDDARGFIDDVLAAVRQYRPRLIIPAVESTLVVLNAARDEVEREVRLAAPPSDVLACALDKARTLELAAGLGIPIPRTAYGNDWQQVADRAATLPVPAALKPRGPRHYGPTAHGLDFKVRYAASRDELNRLLGEFTADASNLLVQECTAGLGRCVAAVCREGEPLVLFAYARDREYPLGGGVSVLRRSVPLDPRLREWTTALLRAMPWHGVAMVEFKYDPARDQYWLMEVNGRFQASTALSLDAGLNLPEMVVQLFTGEPVRPAPPYRIGVRERWLQGDLLALWDRMLPQQGTRYAPGYALPSRRQALLDFLRGFSPSVRYDEFRMDDWRPGLREGAAIARVVGGWLRELAGSVSRRARQWFFLAMKPASTRTQRSIRA